jgi:predicted naringenin-chalcone synthase
MREPLDTNEMVLVNQLAEATARVGAAHKEFNEVLDRFPGGPAHPGGVQEIKDALKRLTVAREQMSAAQEKLNEYLQRGIVPDNLKRSA